METNYTPLVITGIFSVLASSGLWTVIQKLASGKSARDKLLIGIAHDRILFLGTSYLTRGWITQDEYENLYDYLWVPYKESGGNGTAAKVMDEVKKLEIIGTKSINEYIARVKELQNKNDNQQSYL